MMTTGRTLRWGSKRCDGFTLIELLVVVAIIALLISILLPSLNQAREQAKATKCAANMSQCGKAIQAYLAENKATFPSAYYYATDNAGNYNLADASELVPFGYVHWSYQLFGNGQVQDELFQCPSMPNRGHPRTNPGSRGENWEDRQVDVENRGRPASTSETRITDRQATRMAYTANAAIMPRNKFAQSPGLSRTNGAAGRYNKFVRETEIDESGRTIVVTEFNRNWVLLAVDRGGDNLSKSHRPLNPFANIQQNYAEYSMPLTIRDPFSYWSSTSDRSYGLLSLEGLENQEAGGAEAVAVNPLNYVGRHHPGGDKLGGTANFMFIDGHVERKAILKTLIDRQWGKAYYSMTGPNRVSREGWEYEPH